MSSKKDYKREKTLNSIKLKEKQDSRLTSRHIATLMKLDDLTLENEKLKSKLDLLEKEVGSCIELHDFARNSKQKIAELRQEYESKLNIIVEEQNQLLSQQEKEFSERIERVISQCNCEKEDLKHQLMEAENRLKELDHDKNEYEKLLLLSANMEPSKTESDNSTKNNDLESKNKLLKNEVLSIKKESIALKEENNKLNAEIQILKSENLQCQRNQNKEIPTNNSSEELDQLSTQLDMMMNESKKYDRELQDLRLREIKRDEVFNDLNKRIELYEMERNVLKQTSSDRATEILHLKEQLKSAQSKTQSLPNSPMLKYATREKINTKEDAKINKPQDRISFRSGVGKTNARSKTMSGKQNSGKSS